MLHSIPLPPVYIYFHVQDCLNGPRLPCPVLLVFLLLLKRTSVIRDNLLHPLRSLLRNRHAVTQTEAVGELLPLINLHNRLPVLPKTSHLLNPLRCPPSSRLDDLISRFFRHPVILLSEQELQLRTLVLVLRRVRGAPNLVVPEVSIDLEHLVTGHVQRLLDAVGGFDERGRGVCRVVREAHEVLYQFRQQRDGEQQREEVNKDSCEKGEVGVLQERLYKRLAEARDQQEAKNHIPQPSARSRS